MASNKEKLIAAAQKLVEKGQYDKAVKEYLRVVAEDQNDVRIWLKVGDLYAKLNRTKDAADTYQRVAVFYSDQGHYLKAVAVYKQILRIEPRMIDINLRLAEMYKQLGLLSDAMQQYETIAAHFHKEGKTKDALSALKQIVELDPENVASRIKLAELYSKEGMTKEAIDEFGRAAQFLHENDRFDDYLKVAERLLFHQPNNRAVSREAARLYTTKGDPRRALAKLQVCLKADARDVKALALLGAAFEALGQLDKTVSVLKELARVLGENGSHGDREDAYRKILEIAPEDAEARGALSGTPRKDFPEEPPEAPQPTGTADPTPVPAPPPRASMALRDREEAEAPARAAPQARLQKPTPVMVRGASFLEETAPDATVTNEGHEEEIGKILTETDVYTKYGLHAKAMEHLQKVFAWVPEHLEAREKLKTIYLAVGRVDDAVDELFDLAQQVGRSPRHEAYLREILQIQPGNGRALELLASAPAAAHAPLPQRTVVDAVAPPRIHTVVDEAPSELEEMEEISAEQVVEIGEEDPYADAIAAALAADAAAVSVVIDDEPPADEESYEFDPALGIDDATLRPEEEALDAPMSLLRAAVQSGAPAEFGPPQPGAPEPAEGNLEDDLDEADFFIQQNLLLDARHMMETLKHRHPGHPLVESRLLDLEGMERAAMAAADLPDVEDDSPAYRTLYAPRVIDTPVPDGSGPRPAELQESTAVGGVAAPVIEVGRKSVVERGVTPEDFETHYDLGIAYKEMGLIDDAIAEFNIVMQDASREVLCHMMIGLCFVEKGLMTDAIGHFKEGLYAERIQEREEMALYYELGMAYERLADAREALYYYDKVIKRDTTFRDVERRIFALRGEALPDGDVSSEFDPLLPPDEAELKKARGK
ncbi:MAG: tetratricopeptide repeat protein [Myxococcales bacterium]|nr:tetratricopeptide repeat protein [Myxococcales bacterium]